MNPTQLLTHPLVVTGLDLVIKASVILLLAMAAALALRKSSAAVRHRVWCLAFAGLFMLPVFSIVMPELRLPILAAPETAPRAAITLDDLRTNETVDTLPVSDAESVDNQLGTASNDPANQSVQILQAPGGLASAYGPERFGPGFEEFDQLPGFVEANGFKNEELEFSNFPGGLAGQFPFENQRQSETFPQTEFSSESSNEASIVNTDTVDGAETATVDNATAEDAASQVTAAPAARNRAWAFTGMAVLGVWLAGYVLFVIPVLFGVIQNFVLGRDGKPLEDAHLRAEFDAVLAQIGLRRRVCLLESDDSVVPMTWGLFRPVILLPKLWRSWSVERRRIVLLHEVSHVKRHDVAVQLLSRLVCTLYWFHPLAWLAIRRLRIESELSCDDCVLLAGESPQNYAAELVQLARSARRVVMPTALAMAQPTSLEQRIRAMLDRARSRLPLGRNVARVLLFASVLLVAVTAAIRPVEREAQAETNNATATDGLKDAVAASQDESSTDSISAPPASDRIASDDVGTNDATSDSASGQDSATGAEESIEEDEVPEGVQRYMGTVVDPAGQPVQGATVQYVWAVRKMPKGNSASDVRLRDQPIELDVRCETTTDARGQFTLLDNEQKWERLYEETTDVASVQSQAILVTADGYLSAWADEERILAGEDTEIRIAAPMLGEIEGQLLSLEGTPIADATITPLAIGAATAEDVEQWLADVDRLTQVGELPATPAEPSPSSYPPPSDYMAAQFPARDVAHATMLGLEPVAGDKNGRFTLSGLAKNQLVILKIDAPGHARTYASVMTNDLPVVRSRAPRSFIKSSLRLRLPHEYHGSQCTLLMSPSQPVFGVVRDSATNKPVPGIGVSTSNGDFSDITDENGAYRLDGVSPEYLRGVTILPQLQIGPRNDQPYFHHAITLPQGPGVAPVEFDVTLTRGVWVSGRVTNQATGAGVADVTMNYTPYLDNVHADKYGPVFDRNLLTTEHFYKRFTTDENGNFRALGIPGRGVVTAYTPEPGYRYGLGASDIEGATSYEFQRVTYSTLSPRAIQAMHKVAIPESAEEYNLDVVFDPGHLVTLNIRDEDGNPLSDVHVGGDQQAHSATPVRLEQSSQVRVLGLGPREMRLVSLVHKQKQLGLMVRVTGGVEGDTEQTVTLPPLVPITGRLVDADGEPLVGARVRFRIVGQPWDFIMMMLDDVYTDSDGRFTYTALAGGQFQVVASWDENRFTVLHAELDPQPYEAIEFGEVNVSKADRPEPVRRMREGVMPAAGDGVSQDGVEAVDQEQLEGFRRYTGTVVDPDGNPVARATVRFVEAIQEHEGGRHGELIRRFSNPPKQIKTWHEVLTDANGQFMLKDNSRTREQSFEDAGRDVSVATRAILVSAEGFHVAWKSATQPISEGTHYEFQLAKAQDLQLQGTLLNLEGTPVGGAKVTAATVCQAEAADVARWREDVRRLTADGVLPVHPEDPTPNSPYPPEFVAAQFPAPHGVAGEMLGLEPVTTAADGTFTFSGLAEHQLVILTVEAQGYATASAAVITHEEAKIAARMPRSFVRARYAKLDNNFYGLRSSFIVSPAQPVVGTITDSDTGAPIPDVWIYDSRAAVGVRSDADGKFSIEDMPPDYVPYLHLTPPLDAPYFFQLVSQDLDSQYPSNDASGLEPVFYDIKLPRGVWIEGRIADATTGEGVPGAVLTYMPYLNNENSERFKNYHPRVRRAVPYHPRFLTDENGDFRVLTIPGRGIVTAAATGAGYRTCVKEAEPLGITRENGGSGFTYGNFQLEYLHAIAGVDVPENAESFALDLTVEPGLSVPLSVRDFAGQPITGFAFGGDEGPTNSNFNKTSPTSRVDVIGLSPGDERIVGFHDRERKIGLVTKISPAAEAGADEAPRVVRLGPLVTITGRLVDGQGEPIAEARLSFQLAEGDFPASLNSRRDCFTDADGRFRRDEILPGVAWAVYAIGDNFRNTKLLYESLETTFGEIIDLGEIDVTKDDRPEPKRTKREITAVQSQADSPRASNGSQVANNSTEGMAEVGLKTLSPEEEAAAAFAARADAIVAEDANQDSQDEARQLSGVVVDADGNPVEGATVRYVNLRVVAPKDKWWALRAYGSRADATQVRTVAEAVTDAAGRFSLDDNWAARRRADEQAGIAAMGFSSAVVATAPGFVPSWERPGALVIEPAAERKHITLLRGPRTSIQGQLIDLEGRAIAGATVYVECVATADAGEVDRWLADVARMTEQGQLPLTVADRQADYPYPPHVTSSWFPVNKYGAAGAMLGYDPVTSDARGQFAIPDIAEDQLFVLRITAPGHATQVINVVSREMEAVSARGADANQLRSLHLFGRIPDDYQGREFSLVLSPSQPLVGMVRDIDTRKPIAGVLVSARGEDHGLPLGSGETDENGEYHIDGLPPGSVTYIHFHPGPDNPYFEQFKGEIAKQPGLDPVRVDFGMKAGVWVEGTVVNRGTGQGEPDIHLGYTPYLDNPHSKDYAAWDSQTFGSVDVHGHYRTDKDGRFRLLVIPGRGIIAGRSAEGHFIAGHGIREIDDWERLTAPGARVTYDLVSPSICDLVSYVDVPQDVKAHPHDLEVDPGSTVTVQVQDADGNLLTDYAIAGKAPGGPIRPYYSEANPSVEIVALAPGERRRIYIRHEELRLGASVEVTADAANNNPQIVKLHPLATLRCRLIDGAGRPVTGAKLQLSKQLDEWSRAISGDAMFSDENGVVEFNQLIPGPEYEIAIRDPIVRTNAEPFDVAAGEIIDFGVIDISNAEFRNPKRTKREITFSSGEGTRSVVANSDNTAEAGDADRADLKSSPTASQSGAVSSSRSQSSGAQESQEDVTQAPEHYAGKVVDETGAAVAGASVRLMTLGDSVPTEDAWLQEYSNPRRSQVLVKTLVEASTGRDGRFEFDLQPIEQRQVDEEAGVVTAFQPGVVVVTADGYLPTWVALDELSNPARELIRMRKGPGTSVEGRLIDLEGRPVVGAKIEVEFVGSADEGEIDRWLADVEQQTEAGLLPVYSDMQRNVFPPIPTHVKASQFPLNTGASYGRMLGYETIPSDENGRFSIPDLAEDQLVTLRITADGYVTHFVNAVAREMQTVRARAVDWKLMRAPHFYYSSYPEIYHGRDITLVMPPSQPIVGAVRDKDTGEPIEGVWVTPLIFNRRDVHPTVARTNEAGEYRIDGIAPGVVQGLSFSPGNSQPYFAQQIMDGIPQEGGVDPVRVDLDLKAGVWVEGTVTNRATGEPVPDVHFGYTPYQDNALAEEYPAISRNIGGLILGNARTSDADGKFRMLGIPGRGIIGAQSKSGAFVTAHGLKEIENWEQLVSEETQLTFSQLRPSMTHTLKYVEIPVDAASHECDLEVDPGLSRTLRVLDESGNPLTGYAVAGQADRINIKPRQVHDTPTFESVALSPGEPRDVYIRHEGLKLGASLPVSAETANDEPLDVTLRPLATIKCRLVDENGQPIAGGALTLAKYIESDFVALDEQVLSDENGDIEFAKVIPGVEYHVGLQSPLFLQVTGTLEARPGEIIDYGNIAVTERELPEPKRTLPNRAETGR